MVRAILPRAVRRPETVGAPAFDRLAGFEHRGHEPARTVPVRICPISPENSVPPSATGHLLEQKRPPTDNKLRTTL
jgi:hypothetical protein